MSELDVVVFGEGLANFIADDEMPLEVAEHYTRGIGGAEVNVAIALARLGHRVGWISRLGRDPLGRYIAAEVAAAGVDTSRVGWDDDHSTGLQLKSRVAVGDPQIVYYRRGSAASHLTFTAADAAYIATARHLHVTGIPPALSPTMHAFTEQAIAAARAAGLTVSFDPNLRPSLWPSTERMRTVLNTISATAEWVLPGLTEGALLTGVDDEADVAAYYLQRGATGVALKLGPMGGAIHTSAGRVAAAGFPVQVVDTVGAGDGFAAGIISGLLDGLGPMECLRRGNAVGALAVTVRGDTGGLPTRAALDQFLLDRGVTVQTAAHPGGTTRIATALPGSA